MFVALDNNKIKVTASLQLSCPNCSFLSLELTALCFSYSGTISSAFRVIDILLFNLTLTAAVFSGGHC